LKTFLIIYITVLIISVICYYISVYNSINDPEDEIVEVPEKKERKKEEFIES